MKVLVISNTINGRINSNLSNILSAANNLAECCDVFLIGKLIQDSLPNYKCINNVEHYPIDDSLNHALIVAPLISNRILDYSHVLVAADSYGKDLLPRIAGSLYLSQVSEVSEIISPNIFKRAIYAGNILAEIESYEATKLLTIRVANFPSYTSLAANINYKQLNSEVVNDIRTKILFESISNVDTVDINTAEVIVSGGSALLSKDNFDHLIGSLAFQLSGAVGASRAAVESGFATNDCQIGQTGRIVAPKVYIAVGISGAVQHIAGMKNSQVVIAINSDINAPIFEYADYGMVGDLFTVIPELINKLSNN